MRDVASGIRILVSQRKTNQHCLRVLNRGSRDEHTMPRMRNLAAAMTAACEDHVAMCEPGHQGQGRSDTETGRNFLEEDGGFVH